METHREVKNGIVGPWHVLSVTTVETREETSSTRAQVWKADLGSAQSGPSVHRVWPTDRERNNRELGLPRNSNAILLLVRGKGKKIWVLKLTLAIGGIRGTAEWRPKLDPEDVFLSERVRRAQAKNNFAKIWRCGKDRHRFLCLLLHSSKRRLKRLQISSTGQNDFVHISSFLKCRRNEAITNLFDGTGETWGERIISSAKCEMWESYCEDPSVVKLGKIYQVLWQTRLRRNSNKLGV